MRGSLHKTAPASAPCGHAVRARLFHPSYGVASAPSTQTQPLPAAARLPHQPARHRPTSRTPARADPANKPCLADTASPPPVYTQPETQESHINPVSEDPSDSTKPENALEKVPAPDHKGRVPPK